MKLTKDHKKIVCRWIDKQFEKNSSFPEKFLEERKEAKSISPKHFKVLKRWRGLPDKWKHISAWLEDNLTANELKDLTAYVEAKLARKDEG